MIFLIVSIVFMTALALVIRKGVAGGAAPLGLNACFRGTAGLVGIAIVPLAIDLSRLPEVWSAAGPTGLLASFFFWFAGFGAIKAVQLGHLGISWTVLRCSMVMPTVASLVWWKEVPLHPVSALLVARVLGIALTTAAVVLLGIDRAKAAQPGAGRGGSRAWALWLAAAFLGEGAWEIMLRATRSFPDNQTRSFFVTVAFVGAFLMTLPVMAVGKVRLDRSAMIYGVLAGLCGVLASGSRVWALRDLDGIVVFPATTISVMVLVQIAGVLIWREKVGRWGIFGFATAAIGILCLTITP